MNDAVTQSACRLGFQRLVVTIHDPIDGSIADRVCRDMKASVMQQLDRLAVFVRRHYGVPGVAGVLFRRVLIPVVEHPGRSRAAAPVHAECL